MVIHSLLTDGQCLVPRRLQDLLPRVVEVINLASDDCYSAAGHRFPKAVVVRSTYIDLTEFGVYSPWHQRSVRPNPTNIW